MSAVLPDATGPAPATGEPVLSVRDLCVEFPTDDGLVRAVDHVSFDVTPGETLGIVGESGSGKSVSALAVLGLLPKYAKVSGEVWFHGRQLVGLAEDELRPVRGDRIAMIFQDALAALNPVFRVGDQIAEAISVHHQMSKSALEARAVELLDLVGIPNPAERVRQYPHEFSGGMRQRAMIAMAIANEPDVLIADEPTTALDVTVQAQVMEVIARIQERTNTAMILITHDLGVVAGVAERILVMYAGRPAEIGTVDEVFYEPSHPYTRGLLASLPRLDRRQSGEQLHRIAGQPPSLIHIPSGCAFHPRCPHVQLDGPCTAVRTEMHMRSATHGSSCHLVESLPPYDEAAR